MVLPRRATPHPNKLRKYQQSSNRAVNTLRLVDNLKKMGLMENYSSRVTVLSTCSGYSHASKFGGNLRIYLAVITILFVILALINYSWKSNVFLKYEDIDFTLFGLDVWHGKKLMP